MSTVITSSTDIPPTTPEMIEKLNLLEDRLKEEEQLNITTWHTLHAGIYSRTVLLPKGSVVIGTSLKVATTIIISGEGEVIIGNENKYVKGYKVVTGSADRKQGFIAYEDTYYTMSFKTKAKTIQQAEEEFTDDADTLLSRNSFSTNYISITGE
jgi:hypothetical protein